MEPKINPELVEWFSSIKYYDESGKKSRIVLKTHTCNETDWRNFSPTISR
jgi:hypothetical protein